MLSFLFSSTLLLAQGSAPQDLSSLGNPFDSELNNQHEPPMLGIRWARGFDRAFRTSEAQRTTATTTTSANMTYHGGKITPTTVAKQIFWGPSWTNTTFVGDKITGLTSWYTGFSGSNYPRTSDEYTGTNGQVGATTLNQGHVIAISTAANGSSTSVILGEVCRQITLSNITPDPSGNGHYPVYVDLKRGTAGYCAYHSYGTCNSQLAQFAFFFNLDGDPVCNPADTQTGHPQSLAALTNVSGPELSEASSDPAYPGAWYDSKGQENGDKCAWILNVPHVFTAEAFGKSKVSVQIRLTRPERAIRIVMGSVAAWMATEIM